LRNTGACDQAKEDGPRHVFEAKSPNKLNHSKRVSFISNVVHSTLANQNNIKPDWHLEAPEPCLPVLFEFAM
jgi:hypothetical protein